MIGQRLEEYRNKKGYKVEELAAIIGIEQGTLSKIKMGYTQPHANTIEKIVRNTDISAHWLCTGEGSMTREPDNALQAGARPKGHSVGSVDSAFQDLKPGEKKLLKKVLYVIRGRWKGKYEKLLKMSIDSLYHSSLEEAGTKGPDPAKPTDTE